MDKKKIVGKKNRLLQYGVLIVALIITLSTIGYAVTRTITDSSDTYYTRIRNSNGNTWESTGANIQYAIDDLPDGGVVYLPPGEFLISSNITLKEGVILIGSGMYNTVLKYAGASTIIELDSGVTIFGIEKLSIEGYNRETIGLDASRSGEIKGTIKALSEVLIYDNDYGVIWSDNDGTSTVINSRFYSNNVGFHAGSSHPYIKQCNFHYNDVGFNGSYYHGRMIDCTVSYNEIGIDASDFRRCTIENTRFTYNTMYDCIVGNENTLNDIQINKASDTIEAAIWIKGINGIYVNGLTFEYTSGTKYNKSMIFFNPESTTIQSGIVIDGIYCENNYIYGTVISFANTGSRWVDRLKINDCFVYINNGSFINTSNVNIGHSDISGNTIRIINSPTPVIYIYSQGGSSTNGNTIIGNTITGDSAGQEGINASAAASIVMGNKLRLKTIVLRDTDVNTVNESNVEI